MTQATDTDIRDIKTSIESLKKVIISIAENTKLELARLDGEIIRLRSDAETLEAKIESRIDEIWKYQE